MNYTKMRKEFEEEKRKDKEEEDNIKYQESMKELGIEVNGWIR